ncbi:hypothetical protein ACTWQB_08575 [Piscibacillus sp. B03]|uniref:hypothetical protein n=1 Tax=Piscibacillus sp. B03 TaxID=3457430 RepID=UPI003FCE2958
MKRIIVLIMFLLLIAGCASNQGKVETPEVAINVKNESSLLFNEIRLIIFQEGHLSSTQGAMFADQSPIEKGDTMNFSLYKEDPINFEEKINVDMIFYHNNSEVASRELTIDLSDSKEVTIEFNDYQLVVR